MHITLYILDGLTHQLNCKIKYSNPATFQTILSFQNNENLFSALHTLLVMALQLSFSTLPLSLLTSSKLLQPHSENQLFITNSETLSGQSNSRFYTATIFLAPSFWVINFLGSLKTSFEKCQVWMVPTIIDILQCTYQLVCRLYLRATLNHPHG